MVSTTSAQTADPIPDGNRFGIERRGIEHIPDGERRGTPRQLGMMWSGVVLNVGPVVYGALLVSFGLNWWQCLLAIALGNLTWLIAGLCSLAGPAAGSTTFAINRAAFGRTGNRPIALFNWIMQVGYEVLDLVLMVLAASALARFAGIELSGVSKVALVLGLAVAQSVLPVIGHAAVTRVLRALVIPFAALFCVLAGLTATRLHLTPMPPAGWAAFLGGVALSASGAGLGWASSAADYSRYLPRTASRRGIVTAVTLGGGLPQTLLMAVGTGAALVTPSVSDPVTGLPAAYPAWFVLPYLVLLIVQMTALNAIDLYSSGVTLQAVGVPIGRWQAVLLDGVICAGIGLAVVYSGDFNALLGNFLLFMIIWFAPWAAIFVVDYLLRGGRYDIPSLVGSAGRYARPGGLFVPGVLAQAAGMLAGGLWIHTTVFTGPLAAATGGLDLSAPAGFLVAGGLYLILARTRVRAETLA
jgi:nucleobase:cation symporter-1, NCS1 family